MPLKLWLADFDFRVKNKSSTAQQDEGRLPHKFGDNVFMFKKQCAHCLIHCGTELVLTLGTEMGKFNFPVAILLQYF